IKKSFETIKKTRKPEEINNFLIKLSKNPIEEYLIFLDFFIKNLETQIFDKIKLNLIFLLGEIGKSTPLQQDYLEFISDSYYVSDRWIRNEIIQTINKISTQSELSEKIIELIGYAINDEYTPIRNNALKILLKLEVFPNVKNIFQILNSKDSELVENGLEILTKFIPNSARLFDSLNSSNNYKILKIKAIRTVLLICFNSLIYLESLRDLILKSSWEKNYKEIYLKEIDTYERILLKKI
ncbi:hypothetical protein LCGC14_1248190, partial [marine sediment metagenome]